MKIQHLDLHMNDRCNLRCKYCYLNQGDHVDRGDFPDWLINLLPDVVRLLGADNIYFYGGEPMLAFEQIKKIVAKCPNVRFGIVTNGTICTSEQAKFMREHRFGIQRSIDGGPEACRYNRPGVIDKYLRLTDLFGDKGKSRRSTVTKEAVGCMYNSWKWLESQGFDQGWTPIPDLYPEWTEEDIDTFIEQMKLIGKDLVEKVKAGKDPPYHYWFNRMRDVIIASRGGKPNINTSRGCGAGSNLLALRQDGYFFACHRFITDDIDSPWCFGNVCDLLSGRGLRPGPEAQQAIEKAKGRKIDYGQSGCKEC